MLAFPMDVKTAACHHRHFQCASSDRRGVAADGRPWPILDICPVCRRPGLSARLLGPRNLSRRKPREHFLLNRCFRTSLHGTHSKHELGVWSLPLTFWLSTGQGTHAPEEQPREPGVSGSWAASGGRGLGTASVAGRVQHTRIDTPCVRRVLLGEEPFRKLSWFRRDI